MENELSSIKSNKTILSVKILAWADLLFGIIPTILILTPALLNILYCNLGIGISTDCGFGSLGYILILVIVGPLLLSNLIFGIISFKLLRKMDLKGIKMSLIPKIIFLVVASISFVYILFSKLFFMNMILIPMFTFSAILLGYLYFVRGQMISYLSNEKQKNI